MNGLFIDDDSDEEYDLYDTNSDSNIFNPIILDVKILGNWEWTCSYNNQCNICREYLFEKPDNNSTFCIIGKCGHAFHNNCIAKYHATSNSSQCPICESKWIPKNNKDIC
jgi:hypothetical protein